METLQKNYNKITKGIKSFLDIISFFKTPWKLHPLSSEKSLGINILIYL